MERKDQPTETHAAPAAGAAAEPQELLLESAADAEQHRKERGEGEPVSPRKTALGKHYDIGGVADFGPVAGQRTEMHIGDPEKEK